MGAVKILQTHTQRQEVKTECEVYTSKQQLREDLTKISQMVDVLWNNQELDDLGIAHDVFIIYERLAYIKGVMAKEARKDVKYG